MIAGIALAAGVLGGVWWLWRGSRKARRVYRRWRDQNSLVVYGYRERGRPWQADLALAALLSAAGPFVPEEMDAGRAWRVLYLVASLVWIAAGAPPLDRVWR